MCQTPDWSLGDRYLRENAPELAPIIDQYSPCTLKPKAPERYFTILLSGIISQQLPPAVSQDLMLRLGQLTGTPIKPQSILEHSSEELCSLGLTPQKAGYVLSFAQTVVEGKITMDNFTEMTDAQITKQLLNVKGLGQWTIEMFLLLGLCRTDVVPSADFIFKKALKQLLNLPDIPKRGQINKLTEKWRPWRSLAVWYLWQKANN